MVGAAMTLKVVLPSRIFAQVDGVTSITAETATGSFGILPNRLDCAATLVPGILFYADARGETCLAIDRGVLVKTGASVVVAVRAAHGGADIASLRADVQREFLHVGEQEQLARSAMLRLETGFLQTASGLRHD
jgi:F-type H+-transporting ATPase subunit epsilon